MMNFIWGGLMLASILCALATGRMGELSGAVLSGASDAIQLVISMLGLMCLWTGLMRVAEKGGLTAILAKLFSPVMAKLFPDYEKDSPAVKAICMNITANLLGLGNAATPMGIAAMKEMARARKEELPSAADKGMVMFVFINLYIKKGMPNTKYILTFLLIFIILIQYYFFVITSTPMYGLNTSGTTTEPSSCW